MTNAATSAQVSWRIFDLNDMARLTDMTPRNGQTGSPNCEPAKGTNHGQRMQFRAEGRSCKPRAYLPAFPALPASFAHESFSDTARLNTSLPGVESLSTVK